MGLDNGIYIKSNNYPLTRTMLPDVIKYPFFESLDNEEFGIEICYWRKCWGIRNDILNIVHDGEQNFYGEYLITTCKKVEKIIDCLTSWLNKEKWEKESNSIWTYDEYYLRLVDQIRNLSIVYTLMLYRPDIYLVFYDSY